MSILDNVKTCLVAVIACLTVAAHAQVTAITSSEQKPSAKVFYVAKPNWPVPYLSPMKPLVHLAD